MIYNGPSIYKFGGGGGGGYSDGGQLIDGDFIKVENNTISSYNNVSRDPVNFYLELKDGEMANAVVELTTAVNSTINVYVLKNGLYYLLGNVGGNTVNAGEQYNLNIVGNSYALEKITSSGNDPKLAYINGKIYGLKKIGSQYYTTEDYEGIFKTSINVGMYQTLQPNRPSRGVMNEYGTSRGIMYRLNPYRTVRSADGNVSYLDDFNESVAPFRLIKRTDSIMSLAASSVRSQLNLNNYYGNNTTNDVNIIMNSYLRPNQYVYYLNDSEILKAFFDYDVNSTPNVMSIGDVFMRVRLCIDA